MANPGNSQARKASLDNFLKLVEQDDSFPTDSFPTFDGQNSSADQDYSVTATVNFFSQQADSPASSIHIFECRQSTEDKADSSGHSTNTVNDSNEAADSQPNEEAREEEGQRHFVIHPEEEPKAPVVPKVVITQPSSSNLMSADLADSESTDSIPPPRTKTKCCSIL